MADSTAHSELFQYVRATMAVIGMRIYLKELGQGHLVDAPTPINTDAQVVLDGTHCRRVSRAAKWMATRYAMVRQAEEDGATVAVKCATEVNDADIFTKPLTGAAFTRAQASMLGHGTAGRK
jgi:Tfp pilus assembly major pilin PilA